MIWGDDDIANQVDEIFVELPEPNIDTDEDSADEDNGEQDRTGQVKFRKTFRAAVDENHMVPVMIRPAEDERAKMAMTSIEVFYYD
ncbi:hypothetical protein JTB14_002010 [Gonioctena quinquepunctata]|nr:hypothetical protein JTB14_002010 [Gonioctena quinquepunctata]